MSNHDKPGFKKRLKRIVKNIKHRRYSLIIPGIIVICTLAACIFFGQGLSGGGGATVSEDKLTETAAETEVEDTPSMEEITCVCFGDAITAGTEATISYPDIITEQTGIKTINLGIPFSWLSKHPVEEHDAFSMYNLADAITTNNYALQEQNASSDSLKEKVELMISTDWEEVDYITINYGAHEIKSSEFLDNEEDSYDKTTYLGALRYTVSRIKASYPNIEIIITTPLYRFWPETGESSDEYIVYEGMSYTKWVDSVVNTAIEENVSCINLYKLSGFDKANQDKYYLEDGIYLNDDGQRVLGNVLSEQLTALSET